jgi:hypothetical protein
MLILICYICDPQRLDATAQRHAVEQKSWLAMLFLATSRRQAELLPAQMMHVNIASSVTAFMETTD